VVGGVGGWASVGECSPPRPSPPGAPAPAPRAAAQPAPDLHAGSKRAEEAAPGAAKRQRDEAEGSGSDGGAGPPPPPPTTDPFRLPVTHEAALDPAPRAITALAPDRSGARLLAGSRAGGVQIFDFGGMTSSLLPFRTVTPCEGVPVHGLAWSPSGGAWCAAVGDPRLFFFDRDGAAVGETVRGDMYVRDATNTKGHVAAVACVAWHPVQAALIASGSDDGTARLWDAETFAQRTVIKPALARPGRVRVGAVAWLPGGTDTLAAGLADGSLHAWDARARAGRPAAVGAVGAARAQGFGKQDWRYVAGGGKTVRPAHAAGSSITAIAGRRDGVTLATRGDDGAVKLWDLRAFRAPLWTSPPLPTDADAAGLAWAPDERVLAASTTEAGGGGALVFLDATDGSVARRVALAAAPGPVAWPPRLNQVFAGTAGRKEGRVVALFDPARSKGGVVAAAGRAPRAASAVDYALPSVVYTPNALPAFREPRPDRKQPRHGREPVPAPARAATDHLAGGFGSGGRAGVTGGTLLTQHVLAQQGGLQAPAEEDIRAALLRKTDDDGRFAAFTSAYAKTQPDRILHVEEEEEGEGGEGG